ncbi:hypothetical protein LIER_41856 [Lithospermum erythrorhizon]|uniref:Retrovirus-related Pol polyprotein from transposon TNT 1-94-like beta-barrel domain-containing protein n=1 Tax=Lithospermum erythrorhizon TaxID=34254 RepID=A0AAV3RFG5_LITER
MQFLLGLSSKYDAIKDQILMLDPWPTLSKTYSMMAQVEKKSVIPVNQTFLDQADGNSTMFVNKLVSENKKKEMLKFKENNQLGNTELINFAQCENFADTSINNMDKVLNLSWIVDTDASNHMCCNGSLFSQLVSLIPHTSITMPNGIKQVVKQHGRVQIHPKLTVNSCLFVPFFKFNFLSVNNCIKDANMPFVFSDKYYILQDQQSRDIVRIANQVKGLYILDADSFKTGTIQNFLSNRSRTPYGRLHSRQPDISHMKIFGFLCFVIVIGPNTDKLAPRAFKGVFLEYASTQKGYKDLGEAKFFFGVEIMQTDSGIYLNQRKYVVGMLKDVGLLGAKPASILW